MRVGMRRIVAGIAAAGLAGILALGGASGSAASATRAPAPSRAVFAQDSRDDAARDQSRVDKLREQLDGIDKKLAQVYLDLDALRRQIPQARKRLDSARSAQTAAERRHQEVQAQLDAAEGERDRLKDRVSSLTSEAQRSRTEIAGLARTMYRSGGTSPLELALGPGGAEQMGQRAAAANSLARTQSQVLEDARTSLAAQRNLAERQAAVTDRIADLESQAAAAQDRATDSAHAADAQLAKLKRLKERADAKAKQWGADKKKAAAQLDRAQADLKASLKRIGDVNGANRADGVSFGGSGMFTSPLPVPLVITSPFGWRLHPVLGVYKLHNGTDYAAACGTPIHPIRAGVVAAVTREAAGGNVTYVNHGMVAGHSWVAAYVHQSRVLVHAGQHVSADQTIGLVGATGYATGCHLHLTLMRDGRLVSAADYL